MVVDLWLSEEFLDLSFEVLLELFNFALNIEFNLLLKLMTVWEISFQLGIFSEGVMNSSCACYLLI